MIDGALDAIRDRLSKVPPGPWKKLESGEEVLSESNYGHPAEDTCIVDANNQEVIGSSEWLRAKDSTIDFLVHSREDIEFLLNYIFFLTHKE